MSEKRFKLTTEEDICYCEYTYWKGDEPLGMEEVVDVLNEQDDELHKYRTENAELHITILENGKEIDEQQSTIDILLEELVNAQQQGYVVDFLHKNEHCSLIPKELEDE